MYVCIYVCIYVWCKYVCVSMYEYIASYCYIYIYGFGTPMCVRMLH